MKFMSCSIINLPCQSLTTINIVQTHIKTVLFGMCILDWYHFNILKYMSFSIINLPYQSLTTIKYCPNPHDDGFIRLIDVSLIFFAIILYFSSTTIDHFHSLKKQKNLRAWKNNVIKNSNMYNINSIFC